MMKGFRSQNVPWKGLRTALSRGSALRRDRDFVKRPMARELKLEGARGYDGEG